MLFVTEQKLIMIKVAELIVRDVRNLTLGRLTFDFVSDITE